MPLAAGTRLGPYEIVAPLGSGGMGEVYRARDTRLGREVAIKVLAEHRTGSPEVRARFEREAKTISSLNHPHICTLFDVGREGETDYLVMEMVEGETLAARLARGPLPVAELLRLGAQIAEALDRAHRAGVIHRDLKPANVMLTKSGAKLMDFGLARSSALAPPAGGSIMTATAPLTAEGTIVGTFQYMAPEQLEGREADARSDLWALGCVLYEMATGQRAFSGTSQASLIAAIMNAEPRPLSELSPMSPPGLDRLVRECLARDPDERRQSGQDLARDLRAMGTDSTTGSRAVAARPRRPVALERAAWVALVAFSAAFAASYFGGGRTSNSPPVMTAIAPPAGTSLTSRRGPPALSPDGRMMVYAAEDSTGTTRLWVRALDSDQPRPIPGTEYAASPFWSPDAKDIGFFADGKLKRVELASGSPQVLANAQTGIGGTWSREGFILFVPGPRAQITRVSALGGEPATLDSLQVGSALGQAWPAMLPDGRHFLSDGEGFVSGGAGEGLYVSTTERGGSARLLVPGGRNGAWARPGLLYFWRDGALWAQPFDLRGYRLKGHAVRVADGVVFDSWLGCGLYSASENGTLIYQRGGGAQLSELVLVDRAGEQLEVVAPSASYYAPSLSHDGRRVAVDMSEPITGNGDIWIFDLARQIGNRLTSAPENETSPIWSADDSRLYWMSGVGAHAVADIHAASIARPDREETVLSSAGYSPPLSCSSDGRSLVFATYQRAPVLTGDIAVLTLADHKVTPFLSTSFNEGRARLSPDNHWIAYTSDESGQNEVYLQQFPEGGAKWRVSTSGGTTPRWRGDGREIFYVLRNRQMMSVSFKSSPLVAIGPPIPLFSADLRENRLNAEFDVTRDGQRFLLNRMAREDPRATVTLLQGWSPPR